MKLFIFSDLHFREQSPFVSYNAITDSGYTKEIDNFLRGCEFISRSIRETKPDMVFNLGDTIHIPTGLSLKLLSALDLGLGWIEDTCQKQNTPLFHLIGNHDTFSEESKIDFSPFFNHRYGTCYNKPAIETFNGETFHLVPYTSDTEFMTKEFRETKGRINLVHNEFMGAKYENGQFTPTQLESRTGDPVICGHIHKPQVANGVIYCGSVLSMKFDRLDFSVPIGAMLYDTETREVVRIANNVSSHYVKLNSVDELKHLPSKNFIIKLYTTENKSDIEEALQGYEVLYIKKPAQLENVRTTVINQASSKDSLRNYIEAENPDALEIFDKYAKGQSYQ